ncbi:hypothetical protein AwEntero_16760 [Enterobacterales bacterium]|nr:hypothetical protein AwEntero_16760 [Enterobacterales bacterium]
MTTCHITDAFVRDNGDNKNKVVTSRTHQQHNQKPAFRGVLSVPRPPTRSQYRIIYWERVKWVRSKGYAGT